MSCRLRGKGWWTARHLLEGFGLAELLDGAPVGVRVKIRARARVRVRVRVRVRG